MTDKDKTTKTTIKSDSRPDIHHATQSNIGLAILIITQCSLITEFVFCIEAVYGRDAAGTLAPILQFIPIMAITQISSGLTKNPKYTSMRVGRILSIAAAINIALWFYVGISEHMQAAWFHANS